MVTKLTIGTKSDFYVLPSISADKKITASEFNQIVGAVNTNADELTSTTLDAKFNYGILQKDILKSSKCKFGVNIEGLSFGGRREASIFDIDTDGVDYSFANGFKIFRVPFTWERLQPTLNGEFNTTYFDKLVTGINYILNKSKDTEVIIDCHNYASYIVDNSGTFTEYQIGTSQVPVSAYSDLWIRLSKTFGNNPRILYCLMNEPIHVTSGTLNAQTWKNITQQVIYDLRNAKVSNKLEISGYYFTGAWSWFTFQNNIVFDTIDDPINNFIIEVHQYNDLESDGGGTGTVASLNAETVTRGIRNITLFTQWCRRHGYKAHLGEINAPKDDEISLQCLYEIYDYMIKNSDVWEYVTAWGGSKYWQANYPFKMYSTTTLPENVAKMQSVINKIPVPPNSRFCFDFYNKKFHGASVLSDSLPLTRASKGVARDKFGRFTTYENGEVRYGHDGWLIESQRTVLNKLLNYDKLSSTFYVNFNVDLQKGLLAPDGSYNAITLKDNNVNDSHWIRIKYDMTTGLDYVGSVYYKKLDNTTFPFVLVGTPNANRVMSFNTPLVTQSDYEWKRIEQTCTHDSNQPEYMGIGFNNTSSLLQGDKPNVYVGGSGLLGVWQPQLEQGKFATSPIIQTTATSTRQKDDISMIGELLATIQGDFTIVFEVSKLPIVAVICDIMSLNDTVMLQRNADYSVSTTLGGGLTSSIPYTPQYDTGGNLLNPDRRNEETFHLKKIGLTVNRTTGVVSLYQQGGNVATGTATVPTTTTAKVEPFNGYLGKLTVYDFAMTETDLKTVTNI